MEPPSLANTAGDENGNGKGQKRRSLGVLADVQIPSWLGELKLLPGICACT